MKQRSTGAAATVAALGLRCGAVGLAMAIVACSAPPAPAVPPSPDRVPAPIVAVATPAVPLAAVSPSPTLAPVELPARQELAFIRDGNLWLARLDGTEARQLSWEGRDGDPSWSPDGRRLLFVRGSGASSEVFSVGLGGGAARQLTQDGLEQRSPRWAPGGDSIAYVQPHAAASEGRVEPAENTEIWLMRGDGTGAHRLVDGFDPAWSPNGLELAYASNGQRRPDPSHGSGPNGLHLLELQNLGDREILPLSSVPKDLEPSSRLPFRSNSQLLRAPSWASDGRRLAASVDGHGALALSLGAGGGELKIWAGNYEGGVGRSVFAPRGGYLAVESQPATGFGHLLLIDTVSSQAVDIGSERQNYSVVEPAWAPDGHRLAVIAMNGPLATAGQRELLVFGTDGGVQSRAAVGDVRQPAWNPAR